MVQRYAARVDLLVEQMEERLNSEHYLVGEKLPSEGRLAADLGVSRPLVREMLARLRERGYIETLNGRGSFVRPRESAPMLDVLLAHISVNTHGAYSADDLYAVRRMVECEAASIAATQATAQDLADLENLVKKMAEAEGDPETYTVADANFHLGVARATQNSLFPALLSPLIDVVVRGIYDSVTTFREGIRGGNRGHRAILSALRSRDSGAARSAMQDHLGYSRTTFPEGTLSQAPEGAAGYDGDVRGYAHVHDETE